MFRIRAFRFVVLLLLSCLCGLAIGSGKAPTQYGNLSGTVRTQVPAVMPSVPIAGVKVRALKGNKLVAATKTNAQGAYSLPHLATGGYKLKFVKAGYFDVSINSNVSANNTKTEDAYLTPQLTMRYLSVGPGSTRTWNIRNPFSFAINYTWSITGSSTTGSGVSTPGNSTFATPNFTKSQKLQLFINGILSAEKKGFSTTPPPATGFVAGTVTDNHAVALTGATITVSNSTTDAFVVDALTAPDGSYLIELSPGTYDLSFSLDGYSSASATSVAVLASSTTNQNAVLTLLPTVGTVAGTVTATNNGNAISGVLVEILDASSSVVSSTFTDSDGTYSTDVAAGTYSARFTRLGYNTLTTPVVVTNGNTTIADASLISAPTPTTGTLAGTVTDVDTGLPLGAVTVQVLNGSNAVVATTTTDGISGGYSVQVFPGTYSVSFTKSGYFPFTATNNIVSLGQTTTVDVELAAIPPNGNVFGHVTTGSQILAGVSIDVSGVPGTYFTDTNGAYNISLAPGTYTITFNKDGYVNFSDQITIVSAHTTNLDVNLRPSRGHLVGIVRDVRGNPLVDVSVRQESTGIGTLTAADGSYDLELPVGTVTITYYKQYYPQSVLNKTITLNGTTTQDVILADAIGTVHGIVSDQNHAPLSNVQISLARDGQPVVNNFTDSQGRYSFTGHAGPYTITFTKAGYGTVTETGFIVYENDTMSLDETLASTTGSLSGSVFQSHFVTGADGYPTTSVGPLSGATVQIFDASTALVRTTTSDASGAYNVAGLLPGTYSMHFASGSLTPTDYSGVSISAGFNTIVPDVTLATPSPGVLEGVVYDPNAMPLGGVSITIQGAGGSGTVTTAPNGSYVAWGPAGTYTVTFSKTGYNSTSITDVVLTSGQVTTLPATLSLADSLTVGVFDAFPENFAVTLAYADGVNVGPVYTTFAPPFQDYTGVATLSGGAVRVGVPVTVTVYKDFGNGSVETQSHQAVFTTGQNFQLFLFGSYNISATANIFVVDPQGNPISGATGIITLSNGNHVGGISDATGFIQLGPFVVGHMFDPTPPQHVTGTLDVTSDVGNADTAPIDLAAGANPIFSTIHPTSSTVTITVNQPDGNPAADASVSIGPSPSSFEGTTDANGVIVFTGVPVGDNSIVAHHSSGDADVPITIVGTLDQFTVTLVGRGSISGLVFTGGGKTSTALPGALISVVDENNAPVTTTTSDLHGGYNIPSLSAGTYTLTVSLDGYVTRSVSAVVNAGQDVTQNINMSAAPQFSDVTLTVLDINANPLPGIGAAISSGGVTVGPFTTDANGIANFTGFPAFNAATVTLISNDYYGSAFLKLLAPGHNDVQVNALPNTGSIAGTVYDSATGQPLEGATVSVTDSNSGTFTATSAADGTFLVENVFHGVTDISVSKNGYESQTTGQFVTGGATLNISFTLAALANPMDATVTVQASLAGVPVVANVTIDYGDANPPTGPTVGQTGINSGQIIFEHQPVGVPCVIGIVNENGDVLAVITRAGFRSGSDPANFIIVGDAAYSGNLEGTVTDAEGGLLANASVIVQYNGYTAASGQTDGSGHYKLYDVASLIPLTVQVSHAGYETATFSGIFVAAGQNTTQNATLSPPLSNVTLTVRDLQNVALAGATVTVTYSNGAPSVTATSDANGQVTFAGQPSGVSATITVVDECGTTTTSQTFTQGTYSSVVRFIPTYTHLHVLVVAGDGSGPIAGATVVAGGQYALTDVNGEAVFDFLVPVGIVRIDAASPDARIGGDSFTLIGCKDFVTVQVF